MSDQRHDMPGPGKQSELQICMASGDLNFHISKERGAPINSLFWDLVFLICLCASPPSGERARVGGGDCVKGETSLRAQVGNLHIEMYGYNLLEI